MDMSSWINRYIARIFSALALALCAALTLAPAPAVSAAPSSIAVLFQNRRLVFTHVSSSGGTTAIGVQDPALATLLRVTGAVMTWHPGERYVLITTAEPQVISFSVGERAYEIGPLEAQAQMAPYTYGDEVYLPLDDLLHALSLALRPDGSTVVLQPQLSSLDVQSNGGGVSLVAHAGLPLHPRVVEDDAQKVVYEFDGLGSTLAAQRAVNAGGVRSIAVTQIGNALAPKILVTIALVAGAQHGAVRSNDDRDFAVSFRGGSGAPAPAAPATIARGASLPTPLSGPTFASSTAEPLTTAPADVVSAAPASPALAQVTAVSAQTTDEGMTVTVQVQGSATYAWHRLRDPDNRFWLDIQNARLQVPPTNQTEPDPAISLRVHQNDPTTVRVAISLAGPKTVAIFPATTGLVIAVSKDDAIGDVTREGQGSIGDVVASADAQPGMTPMPLDSTGMSTGAAPGAWKFGPRTYVPTNPKLIVIDPGHGGSDPGAQHDGVTEAQVNLDMALRLRDILIARGWQVQMTRTTDVDVFAPNDSPHDELQARVDVGNNAGARLFVSIHANSFINAGPSGTTTYFSKPIDAPLAQCLQSALISALGTKDDGIVKSHLYVTLHTFMPAALVETAFLSNPADFARLTSPEFRQKVAQAIADGIAQYVQQNPLPSAAQ